MSDLTATEMGRLGGKARDKALTAKRKSEIARKGGFIRWANEKRKKKEKKSSPLVRGSKKRKKR